MLTDEYDFYHAVAQFLIPFLLQLWVVHQYLGEFIFRHGCQPLTSLLHSLLFASLLEHVAHIPFIIKIADSLGANHVSRPFSCYEIIEEAQVERFAAVVDKCTDSIFLNFSAFMVMVMIVVVMMMLMLIMVMLIVVMVMMLMFVFLVMIVMMVMMLMFVIIILFFMLFVSF